MTYIIEHDRETCIGCGACAAIAPENWKMENDGKSQLIDAEKTGNIERIELEDLGNNKDAAQACPVNVIHIVKKESGEKII